eukprot:2123133-Pleurochrysis_carterae.AAC.1
MRRQLRAATKSILNTIQACTELSLRMNKAQMYYKYIKRMLQEPARVRTTVERGGGYVLRTCIEHGCQCKANTFYKARVVHMSGVWSNDANGHELFMRLCSRQVWRTMCITTMASRVQD